MRKWPNYGFSLVFEDGMEMEFGAGSGMDLESAFGVGLPPVDNITVPYAILDGSVWQRSRTANRTITLVIRAMGKGIYGLHVLRSKLVRAINPHRLSLPVRLKYRGADRVLYIEGYYAGGMELPGEVRTGFERIALQLLCVDPFWKNLATESQVLDVTNMGEVNHIVQRAQSGEIDTFTESGTAPGLGNYVLTLGYDVAGRLYAGGAFGTVGSVWEPFDRGTIAAPFGSAVAGAGTATVAGGEARLNTSGAVADAAMIFETAALDAGLEFQLRVRWRAVAITAGLCNVSRLSDKATAPAVNNTGDSVVIVYQSTAGQIVIAYYDNAATQWWWNGAAWVNAAANAYAGAIGTAYETYIVSNGVSWQVEIRDAAGVALTTTTAVTWALTRAIANSLWWWAGDQWTADLRIDLRIESIHIEDAAVPIPYWARWDSSQSPLGWTAMPVQPDGTVRAQTRDATGLMVLAGDFVNAGGAVRNGIATFNPTTWAYGSLGAGMNLPVFAVLLANDRTLYAGGSFTTAGGGAALYIARWTGAAWTALGAGLNGPVNGLAEGPDGSIYAMGNFTAVAGGGITVNRIARWNGTAWSALGTGFDAQADCAVFLPSGELVVGGVFTTAGGIAASAVAIWNGQSWRAMGAGFTASAGSPRVYALILDESGQLHAAGHFDYSGAVYIGTMHAVWRSPVWLASDTPELLTATDSIYALINTTTGILTQGGVFSGTYDTPHRNVLTNSGSAIAYPVFTLTGPGRLYHIINYTTGLRIDFDLDLAAGETVVLDLRPSYKTLTSNFRGNLISLIRPSDLTTWGLQPGANDVAVWVADTGATGSMTWTPRYWSWDGATS